MRLQPIALLLLGLMPQLVLAADQPPEEELSTVLGNQDVKTNGDAYVIDGQAMTLPQLLATVLPQREQRLQAMRDAIAQRIASRKAATSSGAMDAKRAACQQIPANTIDYTKCYQELAMLREAASQSNLSAADERRDAENQITKLDQDIAAIDAFKGKYGPATAVPTGSPMGVGSIPFN